MDHQNSTMVNIELLLISNRPLTADGWVGCVMLRMTGEDDEIRWFDFRPSYMSDVIRVVWDKGTMIAILPATTAETLLRLKHARLMTPAEVEAFNAQQSDDRNRGD